MNSRLGPLDWMLDSELFTVDSTLWTLDWGLDLGLYTVDYWLWTLDCAPLTLDCGL